MKIQVSMTFQELEDLVREQTGMDIAIIGDVEMTEEGFTFLAGSGNDKPSTESNKKHETEPAGKAQKTAIPKALPKKEKEAKKEEEQEELPFTPEEDEPVKEKEPEEKPLADATPKPSLFGTDAKKDPEAKAATKSLFG